MAYHYRESDSAFNNGRIIDMPNHQTMSTDYHAVSLDPEFDWDLSGSGGPKSSLSSTIHPFHKQKNRVYGKFQHAVKPILAVRSARRTFAFIVVNLFVLSFLFTWCNSSNSLALQAYAYQSAFDLMTLVTCLISIRIAVKQQHKVGDNLHVVSYERVELLFVFASVVLSMLGSVFILKETTMRIVDQPEVTIGRLIPAAFCGLLFHVAKMCTVENKAFQSITETSSSSFIQEHVADMSQSLCSVVPMLSRLLLPRVDPFFLASFIGAAFLLFTDLLIQIDAYFFADTVSAVLIASLTLCTMWPIANCAARVLLNTTPPYVLAQLDKLLSETQTLDGVLEIRNERFYTIALSPAAGKSHAGGLHHSNGYGLVMAGALQVRVRRDADEQMVLAHVTNRLAPLVSHLTVQIVKDDWGSTSGLTSSGMAAKTPVPAARTPKSQSSLIYGFNKPAAAVAPYQQTPSKAEMSKTSSVPAVPKKLEDDFTFTSNPVLSVQSKPVHKTDTPGSNIARMYKAAGFTSPPKVGGKTNPTLLARASQRTTLGNLPLSSSFTSTKPTGNKWRNFLRNMKCSQKDRSGSPNSFHV